MTRRRTCHSYAEEESPGVGGLCRSCQHNQTIIIQLLSSYDPPESSGAFEQLSAQYRRDLERRYPLCPSCKCYVDQRLNSIGLKLKTRKLAGSKATGSTARISQLEIMKKEIRQSPSLFFPLLNLAFDLFAHRVSRDRIESCLADNFPDVLTFGGFPLERHLPSIIGALGIFGALQSIQTGLWSLFLYASLTGLRFALNHTGLFTEQKMEISCFALILLIDLKLLLGNRKPTRKIHVPKTREVPVHPGKLPMNSIETSPTLNVLRNRKEQLPSPSKTIAKDLMDIDWGLGSSTARPSKGGMFSAAPFSASLPTTERKPTFAPSKLDPHKAVSSMFNTPVRTESKLNFSLHPLKPAVLPVEQAPSGIEGVFGGFNFTEPTEPSKPFTMPKIQIPKFGVVGQVAITLLLLALRIMARNRILLHGIVLAASFAVHGPIWTNLPMEWKYGCMGTAGVRFACLAAQLAEPDFAEVMAASLLLRLFCLFLDLTVIIIR